ncbi:MAG: hypothetical protein IME93_03150 [Proteobacteria bacterium]|nr:hypothetical protein [Pseudomonadota bacterium]
MSFIVDIFTSIFGGGETEAVDPYADQAAKDKAALEKKRKLLAAGAGDQTFTSSLGDTTGANARKKKLLGGA